MNDLQSKLGGGINKIQDSLQQGKQKLQTAQEISQIKKLAQSKMDERSMAIVALGEETYKKIRNAEINDSELLALGQPLLTIDQEIYQLQEKLSIMTKEAQSTQSCPSCQAPISENDKFCGGCGTPVAPKTTVTEGETVNCTRCEVPVPVTANYCGCCGNKML